MEREKHDTGVWDGGSVESFTAQEGEREKREPGYTAFQLWAHRLDWRRDETVVSHSVWRGIAHVSLQIKYLKRASHIRVAQV